MTLDVGKAIRTFRELREMTQADLAQAVGVSQPTISTWERNEVDVSMRDLGRLMPALDIDLLVFCRELLAPTSE